MNILHLYKDYYPVLGGIENHVKQLAEAQAERGHAVTVLVASRDRRTHVEQVNGVRVKYAGRLATISSAPISFAYLRLLSRERPDIVHMHFPYPWGEVANLFLGRGRKAVITYHSDIVRQKYLRVVYAPLMQCVLARVDRIVVTSPNYAASSPVLTRWSDKCTAIPLGIDPQRWLHLDASVGVVIRKQLGVEAQTPLLLFVGALRYYKGLQYLLHALPALPGAHLAIVGQGPMESEWKGLTQSLELTARVHWMGPVADHDLPPFYAACDLFVFPSSERSEAFGVSQLEAMAAAKPVVCTELGTGTSFVTRDGETGLIVPPRDPHALAGAIGRVLADADLSRRMGAAGRARVCKEFTLTRMVDRVLQVYADVGALPTGAFRDIMAKLFRKGNLSSYLILQDR